MQLFTLIGFLFLFSNPFSHAQVFTSAELPNSSRSVPKVGFNLNSITKPIINLSETASKSWGFPC